MDGLPSRRLIQPTTPSTVANQIRPRQSGSAEIDLVVRGDTAVQVVVLDQLEPRLLASARSRRRAASVVGMTARSLIVEVEVAAA